ncbi:hypothetical protein [Pseudomonas fluorescens]|uniref:Uncharacterized protein n=1 Tax=Pseudomonas fluorescens TaxID=294 RepID=A0A5E6PJH5_PSEFL|nr:hypothetical protein [Pseudomonas fluorescens]VVM43636.1 hypothetical protein PS655_00423 [Pseudomonas fluorescens]
MKRFRNVNVEAGDLVRALSRPRELKDTSYLIRDFELGAPLAPNQVRILWVDDYNINNDVPSIIVTSRENISSLLPRLLALPSAVTPVTSAMKAWAVEDFGCENPYEFKQLDATRALGFVGLIIGELTSLISSEADLRTMGMDSVRRTLSFVCAQAIIRGWQGKSLSGLAERWLEASEITENEVNFTTVTNILSLSDFLRTLSDSSEGKEASSEILGHQIQAWLERQIDWGQRDLLQRTIPQITRELRAVSSREKRYDIVMDALGSSNDKSRSPLELGFLISLIELGSFEFLDLARSMDSSGLVVAAYCAFAVMLGRESALRNFNGFGWTVLNQGLQLNSEVTSDISIGELRILLDRRRSAPLPFRTRSPWLIDVELAPMIVGSFANVAKRKASSQRTQETSEAIEREEALRGSLMIAMRALEEACGIVEGQRLRSGSTLGKPRGRKK